jgi:class 3 adenylate cyclase
MDPRVGRMIKSTGDGLLATFDGPARAIRCVRDLTHNMVKWLTRFTR